MRNIVGYIDKVKGEYVSCLIEKRGKGIGDSERIGGAFDKAKGYWESLGDEGDKDAHIQTKKQLREVCRRKDLRSKYIENSF